MIGRERIRWPNLMYRSTGITSRATWSRNQVHGMQCNPLVVLPRECRLKWTRGAGRIRSIQHMLNKVNFLCIFIPFLGDTISFLTLT